MLPLWLKNDKKKTRNLKIQQFDFPGFVWCDNSQPCRNFSSVGMPNNPRIRVAILAFRRSSVGKSSPIRKNSTKVKEDVRYQEFWVYQQIL